MLLTFDGPLIDSLREYWASEVVELSPPARPPAAQPERGMSRTATSPPA
jgi:hypothetical protein